MRFLHPKTIISQYLLTILSTRQIVFHFFALLVLLSFPLRLNAQQTETNNHSTNILIPTDSIKNDSIRKFIALNDSLIRKIKGDTIISLKDSISKNAINSKIDYKARDSIKLNVVEKKAYLYGNVEINYESIKLKAAYVEMDFDNNTLYATGVVDSTGKEIGKPEFADGSNAFTAKSLKYNFDTKKGYVKEIFTNEGESFLQGATVKRFNDGSANIKKGFYTTCELEHPHYAIKFSRARMIPNNKIVSGPAYMEIEDVPTPLLLPFGYFPNKKGQISGIILPTYGESAQFGFFFNKFGYYWGVNDFFDLTFQGDIYTRGSWAAYVSSNYKKRYKYEGDVRLSYASNIFGEKFDPKHYKKSDFKISWTHHQDPKARPNSSFSANVNIVSSNFAKYNSTSTGDYLSNTFESSIAYQTSLFKGKSNLTLNLGGKQNIQTGELKITLPEVNFSVTTFYPFRNKKKAGGLKWYDNISIGYTMELENYIQTYDSLISISNIFNQMQNGMRHSIPIRSSVKVLKFLTWTNSININERWYLSSIDKSWYNGVDTSYVRSDTIQKFQMAHDFNFSSEITTKLYGVYQFKKGALKAIRHVMTPSVSFTYRPDFGAPFWGYYHYLQTDSAGDMVRYSRFQNLVYQGPADGLSGKVNFSLNNNLEMKVRNRKDTITGTKKIVLIDYLRIYTAYDIAKDSLNWDPLTLSGRTKLFGLIDISFNGQWDPYAANEKGRIAAFEWKKNHRLMRRENTRWILGVSYSVSDQTFQKKDKANNTKTKIFMNQWNLTANFNFTYSGNFAYKTNNYTKDTIMTLGLSGEFYITPKWKVGFFTGYDFIDKKFSYTSLNIYRDLHCWEMSMEWVPYGARKSYNFTIRIKSSILKDLKINKKSDWRDYQTNF